MQINAPIVNALHNEALEAKIDVILTPQPDGVEITPLNRSTSQKDSASLSIPSDTQQAGSPAQLSSPSILQLPVWHGKNTSQQPKYQAIGEKKWGCALGAMFAKTHTCGEDKVSQAKPKKLWLGRLAGTPAQTIGIGTLANAWQEKVTADLYQLFATACKNAFMVPKHRLAYLPLENEHMPSNHLQAEVKEMILRKVAADEKVAVHQDEHANDGSSALWVMRKWVKEYVPLSKAEVRQDDGTIVPYIAYVRATKTLPESIVFEGVRIPLIGMEEVLGIAKYLDDRNVWGVRGNHCGYEIVLDAQGIVNHAQVVKLDCTTAWHFMHRYTNKHNTDDVGCDIPVITQTWEPDATQTEKPLTLNWKKLKPIQREKILIAMLRAKVALDESTLIKQTEDWFDQLRDLPNDRPVSIHLIEQYLTGFDRHRAEQAKHYGFRESKPISKFWHRPSFYAATGSVKIGYLSTHQKLISLISNS